MAYADILRYSFLLLEPVFEGKQRMSNKIYMIYGKDPFSMSMELLSAIQAEKLIERKDARIIIKPNFVIADRPERGATTHTEIVEAVIVYLKEHGFHDITVAEGSWVGARTADAFHLLGYHEMARKYDIKLLDTKKDSYRKIVSHGIRMEISESVLDSDFIINIPVLKGHCQTLMTHAMKNLKGFLSDRSKRDFHSQGLMEPIAALSDIIRPGLIISDSICGDLDFEEGGNPVESDRMMAATDQFLLDSFSASLMGYDVSDIGYLEVAKEWGIGDTDFSHADIIELNKPVVKPVRPCQMAIHLAKYTDADEACSACYASLIRALKRFEETGSLTSLKGRKIAIGQGFKGKHPELGVGICCQGAEKFVRGCPAKADDILRMLEEL